MKYQYFGDVNDYRKYGLLRILQRKSGLRLGVCWLLTLDDGRSDGRFISYLEDPSTWRHYDPELFDALASSLTLGRRLDHVRPLLPGTVFVEAIVPDQRTQRTTYFEEATRVLRPTELVFFDPDNGIEISSRPAGRKNSSKYLMWCEIDATYAGGQSVLIYQHFPREKRAEFTSRIAHQLWSVTGGPNPICFQTANVVFFLVAQPKHEAALRAASVCIGETWRGQIHLC